MAHRRTSAAPAVADPFLEELRKILGPDGVLADPAAREVYARDASHLTLGRPRAVALPRSAVEVGRILRACAAHAVPVVCRGTGTGLSGGAVPAAGALVLSTARLQGCGPVDPHHRCVTVEPGVLNETVSRHGRPHGLHFAPDPSSQHACTIGGNVAENAGGPHCLRSGVTVQHVLGLHWCDADGAAWTTGLPSRHQRGFGLVNLLCGSEGTLAVVTGAELGLVPDHESLATLLAFFCGLDRACASVVALVGSGLLPAAMEVVDPAMLKAVEQAFAFGFPTDGRSALIVEFAGGPQEVDEDAARAADLLGRHGGQGIRRARDEQERLDLWRCRKRAFGAVGRIAPSYVSMDVVVPLGRLPALVGDIQAVQAEHDVGIATVLHAGDGNLHPGIHFDDRDPDQKRRADLAADAIVRRALARGGSVTGEHGVGIEKRHALPWMLDAGTAALHRAVKDLMDPRGVLNPGKLLPDPGADYAAMKPVPAAADFQWDSLTVTAPAAFPLADLQAAAMRKGLWIPVGAWAGRPQGGWGLATAGTVADTVCDLVTGPTIGACGTARDALLELWAETGDGRAFHVGAPVFKNVAGYDLAGALCGSGRTLIRPLAATFLLRPVPPRLGTWVLEPKSGGVGAARTVQGLLAVLGRLARRAGGRLEPVCLISGDGRGLTAPVVVMVPGRDRPWDLGAVPALLAQGEVADFLTVSGHWAAPLAEALAGLHERDWLPAWAAAGPDWTLLARLHGAAGSQDSTLPCGWRDLVWQGAGSVCWSPQAHRQQDLRGAERSGEGGGQESWHADTVCRDGRPTPLPEPGPGVPLHVLRGLKTVFDPCGALDRPSWLQEAAHG